MTDGFKRPSCYKIHGGNGLSLTYDSTQALPSQVSNDVILKAVASRNDHYIDKVFFLDHVDSGDTVKFEIYAKGSGRLEKLFIFQLKCDGTSSAHNSRSWSLTNQWVKYTLSRRFTQSRAYTVRFDLNNNDESAYVTGALGYMYHDFSKKAQRTLESRFSEIVEFGGVVCCGKDTSPSNLQMRS